MAVFKFRPEGKNRKGAMPLHVLRGVLMGGGLVLLSGAAAWAIGPVGPIGPQGSIGVNSNRPGPRSDQQAAKPQLPEGSTVTGNSIEVSGNTVNGVRCGDGGSASVNSIDVNGASLKGRTVIVQGRNSSDVQSADCDKGGTARQGEAAGQVNSIRIR